MHVLGCACLGGMHAGDVHAWGKCMHAQGACMPGGHARGCACLRMCMHAWGDACPGVCMPGGHACSGGGGHAMPCHAPLWTEFLTHACEKINFPQVLVWAVMKPMGWGISTHYSTPCRAFETTDLLQQNKVQTRNVIIFDLSRALRSSRNDQQVELEVPKYINEGITSTTKQWSGDGNSLNSTNNKNHWCVILGQFKDLVCSLNLWLQAIREVSRSNTFDSFFFVIKFRENHFGKSSSVISVPSKGLMKILQSIFKSHIELLPSPPKKN